MNVIIFPDPIHNKPDQFKWDRMSCSFVEILYCLSCNCKVTVQGSSCGHLLCFDCAKKLTACSQCNSLLEDIIPVNLDEERRIKLVDNMLKTTTSGYMQKRLLKSHSL